MRVLDACAAPGGKSGPARRPARRWRRGPGLRRAGSEAAATRCGTPLRRQGAAAAEVVCADAAGGRPPAGAVRRDSARRAVQRARGAGRTARPALAAHARRRRAPDELQARLLAALMGALAPGGRPGVCGLHALPGRERCRDGALPRPRGAPHVAAPRRRRRVLRGPARVEARCASPAALRIPSGRLGRSSPHLQACCARPFR